MKGTISRREDKQSSTGKSFVVLNIEGVKYYVWNLGILTPSIKEGTEVEFDFTTRTKDDKTYNDITSIASNVSNSPSQKRLDEVNFDIQEIKNLFGNIYRLIDETTRAIMEQLALTNSDLQKIKQKLGIADV